MTKRDDRNRIGDKASLAEIIAIIVGKYKLRQGMLKAAMPSLWEEVMGAAIGKYTTSVTLSGHTLYVRLTSPALSNELNMGKAKIITYLNETIGEELIQKIIING